MSNEFYNIADEFFLNVNLQTTLPLPTSRETVLHFYEAVQKQFPAMSSFYQRDPSGEYILEGDHDSGVYSWLELQAKQLAGGSFNPPNLKRAKDFHRWVLDRSVYFLGVSGLDIDAFDVMFGFNLDYRGNRDAIIAEALLSGSPLAALSQEPGARPVEFEPNIVVALDEGCYLQARISIETRSSSYQVRTGEYDDEPISVYFTVRRYPGQGSIIQLAEAFTEQVNLCEDLVQRIVVPQILQPIASAIAASE
jgi:hypothetical protein